MSRTKKIARGPGGEPESAPEAGPGEAARAVDSTAADQELENIALALPQGAIATLYKFPDIGAEKEWCGELPGADFTVPLILDRWGPGRYIAYFRAPDPNKSGKMVGAGSRRYSIAKLVTPAPANSAGPDSKFLATYAELIQTTTTRALEAQQLQQQMQLALLKSMTERPADTSLDILKAILPALLARPAAAGPDLGALITLADRLANRSSPTAAMKETLELLAQARELSGGDGEGEPAWMRVAAKALDAIGRAVSARGEPTARELGPGPEALPATAEPGALPVPTPPEVSPLPATAHAVFHFLAPHMPALIRHATLDHDPTTYAGLIFDQLQPEYLAEVRDYISRADFLDLLEAHFPAARTSVIVGNESVALREWFKEMRDDLVERIRDALEPPAQTVEVH